MPTLKPGILYGVVPPKRTEPEFDDVTKKALKETEEFFDKWKDQSARSIYSGKEDDRVLEAKGTIDNIVCKRIVLDSTLSEEYTQFEHGNINDGYLKDPGFHIDLNSELPFYVRAYRAIKRFFHIEK